MGHGDAVPSNLAEDYEKNEEFLKKAHHALFEVFGFEYWVFIVLNINVFIYLQIEVITGELECPETGRKFQIQNGIPNMLVNEDEV